MTEKLCACERGSYDDKQYTTCHECFLDRRADYVTCIWCARWHSPKFNVCYKCRTQSPGRDEAGRELRVDILLRDELVCQLCGLEDTFMQIDHIKPCAEGGTADPWNLQALCPDCNRNKGSTWFIGSRYHAMRTKLMHVYLSFGWTLLTNEQQERLALEAQAWPDEFSHHRHAGLRLPVTWTCSDCDTESEQPPEGCTTCARMAATRAEVTGT